MTNPISARCKNGVQKMLIGLPIPVSQGFSHQTIGRKAKQYKALAKPSKSAGYTSDALLVGFWSLGRSFG